MKIEFGAVEIEIGLRVELAACGLERIRQRTRRPPRVRMHHMVMQISRNAATARTDAGGIATA